MQKKTYKAAPMANETSFELPQQLKLPIGLMHYRTACRCIATRSFWSASWAQHGAFWAQLGCPWDASGRLLGQLGRPWALLDELQLAHALDVELSLASTWLFKLSSTPALVALSALPCQLNLQSRSVLTKLHLNFQSSCQFLLYFCIYELHVAV